MRAMVKVSGRNHGNGGMRIRKRLMCLGHCMVEWAYVYIGSGGLRMRCIHLGCGRARTDKKHVVKTVDMGHEP